MKIETWIDYGDVVLSL